MVGGEFLPRGEVWGRAELREGAMIVLDRSRGGVAFVFQASEKVVGETIAVGAFQNAGTLGDRSGERQCGLMRWMAGVVADFGRAMVPLSRLESFRQE